MVATADMAAVGAQLNSTSEFGLADGFSFTDSESLGSKLIRRGDSVMAVTGTGGWYVVMSQPQRERLAAGQLRNQLLDTYLPMRRKTVRNHQRLVTVLAPLFPGYLFVKIPPELSVWRAVNGTRGVRSLLMSGGHPASAPQGFVEALIRTSDENGAVSFRADLRLGDSVSVLTGPFADRIGKLVELDDRGRVAVLMEVLSTHVPVRTSVSNLMPA
jgi:transcriptional antiterminator RfaH